MTSSNRPNLERSRSRRHRSSSASLSTSRKYQKELSLILRNWRSQPSCHHININSLLMATAPLSPPALPESPTTAATNGLELSFHSINPINNMPNPPTLQHMDQQPTVDYRLPCTSEIPVSINPLNLPETEPPSLFEFPLYHDQWFASSVGPATCSNALPLNSLHSSHISQSFSSINNSIFNDNSKKSPLVDLPAPILARILYFLSEFSALNISNTQSITQISQDPLNESTETTDPSSQSDTTSSLPFLYGKLSRNTTFISPSQQFETSHSELSFSSNPNALKNIVPLLQTCKKLYTQSAPIVYQNLALDLSRNDQDSRTSSLSSTSSEVFSPHKFHPFLDSYSSVVLYGDLFHLNVFSSFTRNSLKSLSIKLTSNNYVEELLSSISPYESVSSAPITHHLPNLESLVFYNVDYTNVDSVKNLLNGSSSSSLDEQYPFKPRHNLCSVQFHDISLAALVDLIPPSSSPSTQSYSTYLFDLPKLVTAISVYFKSTSNTVGDMLRLAKILDVQHLPNLEEFAISFDPNFDLTNLHIQKYFDLVFSKLLTCPLPKPGKSNEPAQCSRPKLKKVRVYDFPPYLDFVPYLQMIGRHSVGLTTLKTFKTFEPPARISGPKTQPLVTSSSSKRFYTSPTVSNSNFAATKSNQTKHQRRNKSCLTRAPFCSRIPCNQAPSSANLTSNSSDVGCAKRSKSLINVVSGSSLFSSFRSESASPVCSISQSGQHSLNEHNGESFGGIKNLDIDCHHALPVTPFFPSAIISSNSIEDNLTPGAIIRANDASLQTNSLSLACNPLKHCHALPHQGVSNLSCENPDESSNEESCVLHEDYESNHTNESSSSTFDSKFEFTFHASGIENEAAFFATLWQQCAFKALRMQLDYCDASIFGSLTLDNILLTRGLEHLTLDGPTSFTSFASLETDPTVEMCKLKRLIIGNPDARTLNYVASKTVSPQLNDLYVLVADVEDCDLEQVLNHTITDQHFERQFIKDIVDYTLGLSYLDSPSFISHFSLLNI